MVAEWRRVAVRRHGECRGAGATTGLGGVRAWNRLTPVIEELAQSGRRVLRKMDGRRGIFCLPVGSPDLGPSKKRQLDWFRSQAHSVNFQPTVIVLAASQQGRQETICDR